MSKAIDANVLLYASDSESPLHSAALDLVADLAAGPELLYLFWPVAMAYLRIATHPSVFREPLLRAEAEDNLDQLIEQPHVRTPGERDGFWASYRAAADPAAARGNLVPDAHVVALMHQHGLTTILSRDRDLRRFDGIRAIDPFTDS